MNASRGWFITVEGGEGAGKTTVIQLIKEDLEKKDVKALVTREPGGISIAEQIRAVILDKANAAMDGRTEALLYAAARRQHLVEKIAPALAEGTAVICDRFIDSSLAYQGHARGLGIDEIWAVNEFAIDGFMPDLTLFLDIEPERGLARIYADKQREVNRLDLEGIRFHQLVREGYRLLCERFPDRIVTIDADRPIEQVFSDVQSVLASRIGIPDERQVHDFGNPAGR